MNPKSVTVDDLRDQVGPRRQQGGRLDRRPDRVRPESVDVVVMCPVSAVNPQLPVRTKTAPITTVPTRTLAVVIGTPPFDGFSVNQGTTPTTTGNPYYR